MHVLLSDNTCLFSQSERSPLAICSIIASDVHSFYTNPFYKNVENGQNFNLRSSKNLHKTRRFIQNYIFSIF